MKEMMWCQDTVMNAPLAFWLPGINRAYLQKWICIWLLWSPSSSLLLLFIWFASIFQLLAVCRAPESVHCIKAWTLFIHASIQIHIYAKQGFFLFIYFAPLLLSVVGFLFLFFFTILEVEHIYRFGFDIYVTCFWIARDLMMLVCHLKKAIPFMKTTWHSRQRDAQIGFAMVKE